MIGRWSAPMSLAAVDVGSRQLACSGRLISELGGDVPPEMSSTAVDGEHESQHKIERIDLYGCATVVARPFKLMCVRLLGTECVPALAKAASSPYSKHVGAPRALRPLAHDDGLGSMLLDHGASVDTMMEFGFRRGSVQWKMDNKVSGQWLVISG